MGDDWLNGECEGVEPPSDLEREVSGRWGVAELADGAVFFALGDGSGLA